MYLLILIRRDNFNYPGFRVALLKETRLICDSVLKGSCNIIIIIIHVIVLRRRKFLWRKKYLLISTSVNWANLLRQFEMCKSLQLRRISIDIYRISVLEQQLLDYYNWHSIRLKLLKREFIKIMDGLKMISMGILIIVNCKRLEIILRERKLIKLEMVRVLHWIIQLFLRCLIVDLLNRSNKVS